MLPEGAYSAQGVPLRVGVLNTPTPNPEDYHEGKAIYINEPGFYTIVLGSKKPECRAFKRWVTHEVLPQIRRTGQYHAHDAQAVVAPNGPMGEQLVRLLTTVETRLTAQDETLARIQERLDSDRQRVQLNVRAPKRPAPHDPPIARDLSGAGRPLPLAKYLNQKEDMFLTM